MLENDTDNTDEVRLVNCHLGGNYFFFSSSPLLEFPQPLRVSFVSDCS